QLASLLEQIEDSQALYGPRLGLRIVRKHVSACIDRLAIEIDDKERRALRAELCRIDDAERLRRRLTDLYTASHQGVAA
ncbi:MAG: tRNA dihydrouridine synthase DusB, partial [Alphaproteobacteria bacterium]|nr:tRNA dihydrouridine synthase DusB [Alphaproteobacteria bacterium]